MLEGIDVSSHQLYIDWDAVPPIFTFAIVRGGDGFYRDRYLERNVAEALRTGRQVSVYHFERLSYEPAQMAEVGLQLWEAAVAEGMPNTSRLWLDMEDDRLDDAEDSSFFRQHGTVSWLQEVIRLLADTPLAIYTGRWWWEPHMGTGGEFAHLPLWHSQYPLGQTGLTGWDHLRDGLGVEPLTLWIPYGGWQSPAIWQYSSTGHVPGITGNVDLNVMLAGQEDDMTADEVRQIIREELAALIGSREDLDGRTVSRFLNDSDDFIVAEIKAAIDATRQALLLPTRFDTGTLPSGGNFTLQWPDSISSPEVGMGP